MIAYRARIRRAARIPQRAWWIGSRSRVCGTVPADSRDPRGGLRLVRAGGTPRPVRAAYPDSAEQLIGSVRAGSDLGEKGADGVGHGGRILVDRGVAGVEEAELRVRERGGEVAAVGGVAGAVVAAV